MAEELNSNNQFAHYFGKIPKPLLAYHDEYQTETHNLPDAYIGRNKFLLQTFDYLITKEGREFLTQVVLPFEHSDSVNIQWEVFHFNRTIADIEPEQGMPRYVTQSQDVMNDTMTRRGLAFIIEHGFYETDLGKQHYLMNIQQIVDAVSDTCAYQVIRALLDSDDHYGQQDLAETNKETIRREMARFGVVQRGEHGMHILDSDLKDAMNREGVRPDTYVFPARMSSYIRMRDPYMAEHSRGGLGVVSQAEDAAVLTFRGTRVYECRYFETDYIEAPFDPLEQIITYNEYYVLPDDDGEELYIFDMGADNWFKVNALAIAAVAEANAAANDADREAQRAVNTMLNEELFKSLNLKRFAEKDVDAFNAKYFHDGVNEETRSRVVRELQMMAGTDAVIRPKFLTDLFKTHST